MKRLLFLAALTLGAMLIFGSVAGAQKQATRTAEVVADQPYLTPRPRPPPL
jgi:hypothetical protein